ncbi:MAG: hypothetical protein OXC06_09280 [Acidimicrobiaceae bacterium]|nr:hypothetical protein [Acidimicrobiaceae bacterium]
MASAVKVASRVPLVDLSGSSKPGSQRDQVVDVIRRACEDVGFLVITGHGVADEVVQRIDSVSRAFFSMPEEEKLTYVGAPGIYRGFTPSQASALALSREDESLPDLCELYTVNRFDDPQTALRAGLREGREGFFAPNIWPDPSHVPGFKEAFETYYEVMEDLATRLMRLMALALGLDEFWFDDKIRDHITNLTVNHYPALDEPARPGQFRRGAHSDWGSLTILYHDGEPGLQIMSPDGEWEDVPTVADSFVVNLGDLMAAWTNDRWVSTLHRVLAPEGDMGDRISIAFFHQPTYDAQIECIPTCTSPDDPPHHEPTTSGGWILSMLQKTIY